MSLNETLQGIVVNQACNYFKFENKEPGLIIPTSKTQSMIGLLSPHL